MTNGWDGADPTLQNEPGVDYELATRFVANADLEISAVRVWASGTTGTPQSGRTGKLWSAGGVLQTSVAMDPTLPAGWTVYNLAAPFAVASGTAFFVSYDTLRYYGAVAGEYPNPSVDGSVTATAGRFNNTPNVFPDTASASFYGIDIVFSLGGNLPPVVGLAVSSAGLTGFVAIDVEDETPGSVTYAIHWGDGAVTVTSSLTAQHTYATSGAYSVMVLATDAGGEVGAASEVLLILGAPAGKEIDLQRRTTERFIAARPSLLSLIPRAEVKSGSGVRWTNLAARASQVCRLIEVAAGAGPIRTADGSQQQDSFQLLLPWDGSVGRHDYWTDSDGIRWEVTDILPHNGYEIRAEVTRFGTTGF
jgi:hypothetical protein